MEKENKPTCLSSTDLEDIFEEIDNLLEYCSEKLSNIESYTICGMGGNRFDTYVLGEEDALNAQSGIKELKVLFNQLKEKIDGA